MATRRTHNVLVWVEEYAAPVGCLCALGFQHSASTTCSCKGMRLGLHVLEKH